MRMHGQWLLAQPCEQAHLAASGWLKHCSQINVWKVFRMRYSIRLTELFAQGASGMVWPKIFPPVCPNFMYFVVPLPQLGHQ